MKTSDHLIAGRAVLEKGFTQGAYARDADGDPVVENSQYAVCWCSLGALFLIGAKTDTMSTNLARSYLEDAMGGMSVPLFNDSHPKEKVIAAWDRAIEEAIADGY